MRDVAEVDRAGLDYAKLGFSSTEKLFVAEIEMKEELVWIAKNEAAMNLRIGRIAKRRNCDGRQVWLDRKSLKRRQMFHAQD